MRDWERSYQPGQRGKRKKERRVGEVEPLSDWKRERARERAREREREREESERERERQRERVRERDRGRE